VKFRKKPVVIDAIQFVPSTPEGELLTFVDGTKWRMDTEVRNCSSEHPDGFDYPCIKILTLEGEMTASLGDWIIRGVKGELYPCKPDIFEATYEAVQ
jgi:hypothetical protein